MRILFIHNNFPGQYRRIVERLKGDRNYDLLSASLASNTQPSPIRYVRYKPHREPSKDIHPAARYTESTILTGQAVLKSMLAVRDKGWKPDIVLAHSGWGNSMFVKDAWPDTKLMPYFEWYYQADSDESGFLEGKPLDINARVRTRLKNTSMLQDLAAMDWGQCPTQYQLDQYPAVFHDRVSVLHDGVDTQFFSPAAEASFTMGARTFRKGDPVITYIARGMEPYRGFPQFIEAIARLQKLNPHVHAIVIGDDRVAYGAQRQDGTTWKQAMLAEHQPDMERLHFLGRQPLSVLRDVLRISAAHVYLTAPFVLSWSMLEAMSAGALIVGSATPPVEEVIIDGKNGLLTDFFDVSALVERLQLVLGNNQGYLSLRQAARQTILDRFELESCTSRYLSLINSVASGQKPQI